MTDISCREVLHPAASSSAFNTASSMMDLRQFVDGNSDLPRHAADDFTLFSKNSQSSLAVSIAYNHFKILWYHFHNIFTHILAASDSGF